LILNIIFLHHCPLSHILPFFFYLLQALAQKQNYTDEDINAYQDLADSFFVQWLNLIGYDGITNYIHMVGAGHIRYYLRKWRNMNRFQNQGWEAYNQQVAAFWHHRTTKGGSKHNRSKILPIARWLLRLMMWKTGEGDRFFHQLEAQQNAPHGSDTESDDEGDSDF
jgi:hypothetical protein